MKIRILIRKNGVCQYVSLPHLSLFSASFFSSFTVLLAHTLSLLSSPLSLLVYILSVSTSSQLVLIPLTIGILRS